VRELKNFVFRAVLLAREETLDAATVAGLLAQGPIAEAGAPVDFSVALRCWIDADRPADGSLYHAALAAFERPLFEHALERTGGNQLRAARLLGINRNTLRKRLSDLEIEPERFSAHD
jgi:two-component system nitrogen regulation response regulator GlnG